MPLLLGLGAGFLGIAFFNTPSSTRPVSTPGTLAPMVQCMCLFSLAFGASAFGQLINIWTSEFGVTNRRVLIKTGWIRRRTLELNLSKVESFQVREPLLGRILGYKTIKLVGSGGTQQLFPYVANADRFRRYVVELATDGEAQPAMRYSSKAKRDRRPTEDLNSSYTLPAENSAVKQQIKRAVQLIGTGDTDAAMGIVRQLVKTNPEQADVWYLVGYLSSSDDRKRQAYSKALRINPNHQKAADALRDLSDPSI